jgi:hypothetical protein
MGEPGVPPCCRPLGVDLDITPVPGPEEREALIAALERLLADPGPRLPPQYRSAWRQAGIKESTEAAPAGRGSESP